MHLEPADYPGIFEIGDGRITYLRTGRGGRPKSYNLVVVGSNYWCFEPKTFDIRRHEELWINLPERYNKPLRFKYIKGDAKWDLPRTTLDGLRQRFQQCHDLLWEGGKRNPAQAFDEMTKLMFCKLQDERSGTGDNEPYPISSRKQRNR